MIRQLCIFLLAGSALALGACGSWPNVPEKGQETPANADGGEPDAGSPDAGTVDAGMAEEDGGLDAGVPMDAGVAPVSTRNGVWLTRNYVAYSSFYDPAVVNDLALRMHSQYDVGNWFVNVDRLGADGRFVAVAPHINEFLNNLAKWESENGARFRIFAWVNGATTGTSGMDLTDPLVRKMVVKECERMVSPQVDGSYVASTARPFDGVQIDFEPSGFDQVRFDALVTLMDELRAGFAEVGRPDALLSIAAHKLGTTNTYQWSAAFYYEMARHVDVLASMTYNSGSTTPEEYEAWIRDQLENVLGAVSGESFDDAKHPAPQNGVKVLFGMPAYPASAVHDPNAENVESAAIGLHQGMDALKSTDDPALELLGGGAVYLHTRGIANDSYARWDTEWWWFGHHWLQKW